MTEKGPGWDPDMRKEGIHMKQTARKFLSLLMAFAIVLTLAPTAWAEASVNITGTPNSNPKVGADVTLTANVTGADDYTALVYSWTVNGGTTDATNAASVKITCSSAGKVTAAVTVTGTKDGTAGQSVGSANVEFTVDAADPEPVTPTLSATISGVSSPVTLGSNGQVEVSPTLSSITASSGTDTYTANEWKWAVSPATGVTINSDTSANPKITFTQADNYTISCTAKASKTDSSDKVNVDVTSASVEVKAVQAATGVTMDAKNPTSVKVGQTGVVFKASLTPVGATGTITWSSSDEDVATINPSTGAVVAKKAGTTTITAKVDNSDTAKATATLEVVNPAPTASISPAEPTVAVDGTIEVTASISPSTTVYDSIDWTATDGSGKVTVAKKATETKAVVVGVSAGSAKIKVTFKKGTDTVAEKEVDVTVTAAPQITLELSASTLTFGNSDTKAKTLKAEVKGTLSNPTEYKVKFEIVSETQTGMILISHDDPALNTNQAASTAITGRKNGTARIKATLYKGSTAVSGVEPQYCDVTVNRTGYYLQTTSTYPGEGTSHKLYAQGTTSYPSSKIFSVTPYSYADGTTTLLSGVSVSYKWTLNGNTVQNTNDYWSNPNQYTLYYDNVNLSTTGRTLKCEATFTNSSGTTINTDSISWTVSTDTTSQIPVGVTVYDSNPGYALGSTPDTGSTSIADQIESRIRTLYGSYNYSYYTVTFGSVGGTTSSYKGYLDASTKYDYDTDELEEVVFVPNTTISTSTGSETVSFNFKVKVYSRSDDRYADKEYSGLMTFTIKQGSASSGDVTYSASLGEDVYFNVDDFETFWNKIYSKGTLKYVTFGSASGGTVYNSNGKSAGSSNYYVSPTGSQNALDGVYFSPNSSTSKKATTVRISFTAYGSTSTSGSASNHRTGTVVITYLSAAASKITYTASSGTATLKAQDFIDAYKDAVNTKSNPSNLTIQFQDVPSRGTLTYNDSSKKNAKDVKLTSSNIKSYKFTTKSTGSNQLGDVTYTTGSSAEETISYIGYIGSTATFTGEVTFKAAAAPTDVRVYLPTCYTTAGVTLTASSFTTAHTAMASADYVRLGVPRTGKLVNATGATVSNTSVLVATLGSVTYVPSVTTATTSDSFTFTAYDKNNNQVASGTVTVAVSLPANSLNPNAVTSITQLADVAPNAYFRTQLSSLIGRGVINGTGSGRFEPDKQVEYSEALKFIMNAAGIVREESTVGNWAQNYKNTAVQNGWMSNSVDITKPISRTAMAELAARILGIPQATGQASPFADTDSPWAIALFNATYRNADGTTGRIVQGDVWDNGTRHFNPNQPLARHEMVCLVYNMYMYKGN